MIPRTLRGRIVAGAVVAVALVLGVSGVIIGAGAARTERQIVDDRLRRAATLSEQAARLVVDRSVPSRQRAARRLLRGSGTAVRVVLGDRSIAEFGDLPVGGFPSPRLGFVTFEVAGERWRSYTIRVGDEGLVRVQIASTLADLDERTAALRRHLALVGGLGLLATALLAWLVATLALGPLQRLRTDAAGVARTRDLSRRVQAGGPREVEALSATLNEMLERLEEAGLAREQALEAVRRFAADAGHELRTPLTSAEANLQALARHPDLPAADRGDVLADLRGEHARMAALLDALQALARAEGRSQDAAAVDVAEIVDLALASARARHPETQFTLVAGEAPARVTGWEHGIRAIADNLLENAARHGRRDGAVEVTVACEGDRVVVHVDDDGPGVPAADRERIFGRFVRGPGAAGPGSGLGLAIVAEEARRHGGTVNVGDGPLGGARFTVRLPLRVP